MAEGTKCGTFCFREQRKRTVLGTWRAGFQNKIPFDENNNNNNNNKN